MTSQPDGLAADPDAAPVATPRADATRAAILQAADGLFRTLGYQKTTVADIARALGMSPANVYRFFASKAAINEAICARVLGGLSDLVWSIARGPGTAPDRLRAIFATLQAQTVALFFEQKKLHDMVAAAMQQNWGTIEHYLGAIEGAIRHVIASGQHDGTFAPLPVDRTARLVHAATVYFTHPQVVAQRSGDDLAAVAGGLAELMIRALRPHPDD